MTEPDRRDPLLILKAWTEELPPGITEVLPRESGAAISVDERHGSWVFSIVWGAVPIRIADLALTNPDSTRDASASAFYFESRAAATTNTRYVSETVVKKRRSVKARDLVTFMEESVQAAIRRASSYQEASLVSLYETGVPNGEASPRS